MGHENGGFYQEMDKQNQAAALTPFLWSVCFDRCINQCCQLIDPILVCQNPLNLWKIPPKHFLFKKEKLETESKNK